MQNRLSILKSLDKFTWYGSDCHHSGRLGNKNDTVFNDKDKANSNILYRNVDGESRSHYYNVPEKSVRVFFNRDRVWAYYSTGKNRIIQLELIKAYLDDYEKK